jgi:hypothetical protein
LQVEVNSLKTAMLILLIPRGVRKLGGNNKADGRERVAKKREQFVENRRNDCGGDLSSLDDVSTTSLCEYPCDSDADDELSDADRNECLLLQFPRAGLSS